MVFGKKNLGNLGERAVRMGELKGMTREKDLQYMQIFWSPIEELHVKLVKTLLAEPQQLIMVLGSRG